MADEAIMRLRASKAERMNEEGNQEPVKKKSAKNTKNTTTTTEATSKKQAGVAKKTPSEAMTAAVAAAEAKRAATPKTAGPSAKKMVPNGTPSGVTKQKAPTKTASAAKTRKKAVPARTPTRDTRSDDPPPPRPFGTTSWDPKNADRKFAVLAHEPSSSKLCHRAIQLYRLYGDTVLRSVGDDETVLLNACINVAWQESPESLDHGNCCRGGSEREREFVGIARHKGNRIYWLKQMWTMQVALSGLMFMDQPKEEQDNARLGWDGLRFPTGYPDGFHLGYPAVGDNDEEAEEGNASRPVEEVPEKGAAAKETTTKSSSTKKSGSASKAGSKKTPSKPAGVTKQTSSKTKGTTKRPIVAGGR